MPRRIAKLARLVAVPALLSLGVVGAPAVSAGNPCFHDFTMPPASMASGAEVKLMPCAFEPTVTQVPIGTEVTFFNGPSFTHLVTGANQTWGSPDVELPPNEKISYTFDTAGIYPYACVIHPGMSGAIVVGDLADVLAAGSTTGGSTGSAAGGASTDAGDVSTAAAPAASSTAEDSNSGSLALVALGIGTGLIAGAAAVWLALRRRSVAETTLARAE